MDGIYIYQLPTHIEEAYSGIYKTSRETSVSVAKVYISNGGADNGEI